MPVQTCTLNNKPGYRWGDSGKCYTYEPGNETQRKKAKQKANIQGAAIGEKSTQTTPYNFSSSSAYANIDSMSNTTAISLVEAVSAEVDVSGIITDPEKLAERGLNPKHYIAIVPTELGMAGRVNRNGRIYVPEEFEAEHERLNERLKKDFVDSEENHPNFLSGPGFRIPARLISVETYKDKEGVTRSRGEFAMMNTTAGKDMLVYIEAGLPVGTSSRGRGKVESHVLDDDSPYLDMNPGMEGQTVALIREFKLQKTPYDFVRDPSAMTYTNGGDPRLEAIREMVSQEILQYFGMEETMPAPKNPEASGFSQEQLDAAVAEAKAQVLGEARIVAALALAEQLNPDNKPVDDIVSALEQIEARADDLATKLEAAQAQAVAEKTSLEEKLDKLSEQVEKLNRDRAELERKQALAEAVDAVCESSSRPKAMREFLEGLIGAGLVPDADKAKAAGEQFEKTLKQSIETVTPEAKVEAVDQNADSPTQTSVDETTTPRVSVDCLETAVAALRR